MRALTNVRMFSMGPGFHKGAGLHSGAKGNPDESGEGHEAKLGKGAELLAGPLPGSTTPGSHRHPDGGGITTADYIGIPTPLNLAVPLQPPCLIWRWSLRGGGYGVLEGVGTHVLVFEQTRGRPLREDRQVNHLCNRPFCLQPATCTRGRPSRTRRDRQAELAQGLYPHWQEMVHRLDRALTRHHWEAPELVTASAGWNEPWSVPTRTFRRCSRKGKGPGEEVLCQLPGGAVHQGGPGGKGVGTLRDGPTVPVRIGAGNREPGGTPTGDAPLSQRFTEK